MRDFEGCSDCRGDYACDCALQVVQPRDMDRGWCLNAKECSNKAEPDGEYCATCRPFICFRCDKEVTAVDDEELCRACAENANEHAYERAVSDYYGGNRPTLVEQMDAARRLK